MADMVEPARIGDVFVKIMTDAGYTSEDIEAAISAIKRSKK